MTTKTCGIFEKLVILAHTRLNHMSGNKMSKPWKLTSSIFAFSFAEATITISFAGLTFTGPVPNSFVGSIFRKSGSVGLSGFGFSPCKIFSTAGLGIAGDIFVGSGPPPLIPSKSSAVENGNKTPRIFSFVLADVGTLDIGASTIITAGWANGF